jgi:hypothetical protein
VNEKLKIQQVNPGFVIPWAFSLGSILFIDDHLGSNQGKGVKILENIMFLGQLVSYPMAKGTLPGLL